MAVAAVLSSPLSEELLSFCERWKGERERERENTVAAAIMKLGYIIDSYSNFYCFPLLLVMG